MQSNFCDGGVNVFVQYGWKKQELSPNWKEFCKNGLLDVCSVWRELCAKEPLDTCSMMRIYADYPIKELPNDEVQLINKALQRFELRKDEIYAISLVSYRNCKFFCVLIANMNEENYWWDWCGRGGMTLFL